MTVAPFHGFVWRDAESADESSRRTVAEPTPRSAAATASTTTSPSAPAARTAPRTCWRPAPPTPWTRAGFRKHRHRFFGRTELVRTDPARVLEIDDPHDLARARALAPLFDADRADALPTADDIDAVVLDFDGTQTDDRVLIDSDGREFVSVHRGDGLGIAALRTVGLKMLILSTDRTRSSPPGPGSSSSRSCTASTARTSH